MWGSEMTANFTFSKACPKPAQAKTRMRMLRTLTQAFFFIFYLPFKDFSNCPGKRLSPAALNYPTTNGIVKAYLVPYLVPSPVLREYIRWGSGRRISDHQARWDGRPHIDLQPIIREERPVGNKPPTR
jgi:hypothetical protein